MHNSREVEKEEAGGGEEEEENLDFNLKWHATGIRVTFPLTTKATTVKDLPVFPFSLSFFSFTSWQVVEEFLGARVDDQQTNNMKAAGSLAVKVQGDSSNHSLLSVEKSARTVNVNHSLLLMHYEVHIVFLVRVVKHF